MTPASARRLADYAMLAALREWLGLDPRPYGPAAPASVRWEAWPAWDGNRRRRSRPHRLGTSEEESP